MKENSNVVPLVYAKMHQVMSELNPVSKDGKMSFKGTNYSYQKAEDIVAAIRPLLVKHKLLIFPSEMVQGNVPASNDRLARVRMVYTVVSIEDGSSCNVVAAGDGADSGDKGMPKAQTGAFKYALKHTFAIEAGEDDYDKVASAKAPAASSAENKNNVYGGIIYKNHTGNSKKTNQPFNFWGPVAMPEGLKGTSGEAAWRETHPIFATEMDFRKAQSNELFTPFETFQPSANSADDEFPF